MSSQALRAGRQIGSYTILSSLGSGGMGEVYRARDATLGREVAIKVLPPGFTSDPERLARFEREARVLAALNHPNIATIHGVERIDGIHALVLEVVEGDTLDERLHAVASGFLGRRGAEREGASRDSPALPRRGPGLALADALTIARQIAEALEAAHAKGIVHRDLKPTNIKIRPDRVVKVLDFGLAKASGASEVGPELSTMTVGDTREGVLLGTAAYMSPEQAQAKPVDRRADIWAFGAVLFEMLSGRRGFTGDTTVEVLSNVLKAEPDWTELPAETPPLLRSLLRRCLQKDPMRRLRDIADARFQIEEVLTERAEPAGGGRPATVGRARERLLWVAVIVAISIGTAATAWYVGRSQVVRDQIRLDVTTPPTTDPASLAVSPDGRQVVFVATSNGHSRLWVRSLDATSARELSGTDNGRYPFWSPDSRAIGFAADGQLKRVDLDSGSVRVLASRDATGGAWSEDGTILFGGGAGYQLFRVSADGGEPVEVRQLDEQNAYHRSPQFLPDGLHYLFYVVGSAPGIYVGQLGSSEAPRRIFDAQAGVYAASGHLLFVREGALLAQKFDAVRIELSGSPTVVAEHIVVGLPSVAALSVSAAGPIAYRNGPAGEQHQFVWFDRSGTALETVANSDIGNGYNSSLSHDGYRLAIGDRLSGGTTDIWLLDLRRPVPTRLTLDPRFDMTPVWSPDGRQIAFQSDRKGRFDLYVKSVTGTGSDEFLIGEEEYHESASDWSPDGRIILYTRTPIDLGSNSDVWAVPVDGDRKPFPVVDSPFDDANGQFSPDGRWLAYQSNESGRREIYVQPFPGPGRKVLISTGGGNQVRWRHDGKELFFLTLDNRLLAAPISFVPGGDVEAGTPVPLFMTHLAGNPQHLGARHYMVSRDGQRFLVDTLKEVTLPITVILNWKANP